MSEFVLDSSAILALIRGEPGAEFVELLLSRAVISSVNIAEIVSKLTDLNSTTAPMDAILEGAGVEIVPFAESQARLCGELRRATRSRGLSLGDRACLALAQERGLTAVTADAAWVGADAGPRPVDPP